MKPYGTAFSIVASLLGFLISGCATTSDISGVENRLSYLERRYSDSERNRDQYQLRMEDARKSQTDQTQQVRTQSAELYATMDRLRDEIQKINGRLDIGEHNIGDQTGGTPINDRVTEIEKDLPALKDRVRGIEDYLNLNNAKKAPPAAPEKVVKPEPPAPNRSLPESEQYAKAKQFFDSGDLETAKSEFGQFLKLFPKSTFADAAQFWIAEIFYRQKWYEKAILEYQKVIEGYPKGNKLRAALLKQGFSFFNLGDKANGKLVLKELIKKYPNSNEAKIAKQKLEGI